MAICYHDNYSLTHVCLRIPMLKLTRTSLPFRHIDIAWPSNATEKYYSHFISCYNVRVTMSTQTINDSSQQPTNRWW